MIVDRVGRDDRELLDIYEYVKAKPSKLNMKNLDDGAFDALQLEEKRKAEKNIKVACKVFNIQNFKERFSKDAYHARILVVRSLKADGIRDKYIAENLNLSLKSVRRLAKEYDNTFMVDKALKAKELVFLKEYMNEEVYFENTSCDAEVA